MRWFFSWLAVGALVGAIVATLVAPIILQAFLASTGAKDAMCQCSELVSNTSSLLIRTQLWGAVAGAVVFPTLAWLVRSKRNKPEALPPQPQA